MTLKGVANGGWGVRWTVELKLNRKKRKDSNGGVATPEPPIDPPYGCIICRAYTLLGLRSVYVHMFET